MVKEFRNSTDDSSKGGLGRCESVSPSNAPGRDAGGDDSDSSDERRILRKRLMGLKPRVGCSPCGLDSLDC